MSLVVCRLCMQVGAKSYNINENVCVKYNVAEEIFRHWEITVNDADNICWTCLRHIRRFNDFVRSVADAQKTHNGDTSLSDSYDNDVEYLLDVPDDVTYFLTDLAENVRLSDDPEGFDDVAQVDCSQTTIETAPPPPPPPPSPPPPPPSPPPPSPSLDTANPHIIVDGKCVLTPKELIRRFEQFYELVCDLCEAPSKFTDLANLMSHFETAHGVKGYVKCCKNRMTRKDYMLYHMCKHIQPDAFKCSTCDKLLASPEMLKCHTYSHRPIDEWPFGCDECNKRFIYRKDLNDHATVHLPQELQPVHLCSDCGQKFNSYRRLCIHRNVQHKSSMFICHVCARQFKSRAGIRAHHLHHHTADEEINVQCDRCGKWLKKMCLPKHLKNKHSGRSFPCDRCAHVSPSTLALRNHVKNRHETPTKEHTCQFCGKTFRLKSTLKDHLSMHTGERRFECTFCKRSFASSGNYYTHRKQVHATEMAEKNKQTYNR